MLRLRDVAPSAVELIPWTDRRNRFHTLRAIVFTLLLLPGLWLAFRWGMDDLGPRRANAAIHSTGYYAVWILLASLVVTPAKVLAGAPNVVVVRRMIGNAALAYALVHLTLYVMDQNWRLGTVVMEIIRRFYLTIGFAALAGLALLGLTSTDGWVRGLGRAWKRLHRTVYVLMVLGLIHYVLQSKADVSHALLAIGAFYWLMLWRLLPAGRDRTWPWLLALSAVAALLTLATEYAWYRFGTRADALRVIRSEADVEYGLHPAGQVLVLGVLATAATELRRLSQSAFGASPYFTMLVFGLGAIVDDSTAFFFGWSMADAMPDGESPASRDLAWFVLMSMLGAARWKLRHVWQRHLIDAVWITCIVYNVTLVGTADKGLGPYFAAVIVGFAILLGHWLWGVSRGAALMLVPLSLLLAWEAVSML